ncbi:glutamine synthetase [Acuticoccus sediminis]|uniref:Glutamine synthetase n=1 Tax=Acuticoccus sediminis TaxID=2184697 RepID=A0A8B2NXI0_9HYPH|nr:glutamine synthetase [Acuticoccus sediminis]RAI03380.1 glutamine synthetase [Acuticoccus sediminis]
MSSPRFAFIGNLELSAIFRGRSVPVELLDRVLKSGMPWVPTNVCLSASNTIPPDNPFGPMGETRLIADPKRKIVLPARESRPAMEVYLADITEPDGSFWEACARSQLKRALADLEDAGYKLKVGFEHELYIHGLTEISAPAYSLPGSRAVSELAAEVFETLATAGTRLDQFMSEFGHHQFEISSPVRGALRAADEAVFARETIRDAALARGLRATFAPKPDLTEAGSGVHVHMSLWDRDGTPVTGHNGQPTAVAGSFAAGILRQIDAVMAYTAPTPNSYDRIAPSSWVGAFNCVGIKNREAAIRFVPRQPDKDGSNPGASMEYRVTDGSANPYLTLAALVRAGLAGIRDELPVPVSVDQDPATLSEEERSARGIRRVAASLPEVLAAAEPFAAEWFGETFWRAYGSVRRNEINDAAKSSNYGAQLARVL